MPPLSDRFITPDGIYLLSHSVGLPPRSLQNYVAEHFFTPWERDPEQVWNDWLPAMEKFRAALADLFQASAADFCPQVNVSSATTKILYALPELRDRPTILLSEDAFPSLAYVFQKAVDFGFNVKYVPSTLDAADPIAWAEHLTADVGLVLLTHVHSNTGLQLPVRDIVALARGQGAVTVVDTAQSNGIIPIDLKNWNADFIVGSCVKWLCGGPGAGFLWANPEILERAQPTDVGWFSHAEPFEFDIHQFRYARDALRFWGGTPSIAPFIAATHSISIINEIGVQALRAHNLKLTAQLMEAVDPRLVVSPTDPNRRGGTLVIDLGDRAATIEPNLKTAGVSFDHRAKGIRLSPHCYNSEDEIDRVARCFG